MSGIYIMQVNHIILPNPEKKHFAPTRRDFFSSLFYHNFFPFPHFLPFLLQDQSIFQNIYPCRMFKYVKAGKIICISTETSVQNGRKMNMNNRALINISQNHA